jgi:hypothetical protein
MRHIRKSIAELGNNKWRAHPMYGDCAARTSPMWTGLWHACVETPRNSAHRAARCLNKAPVATTSRATIRSIGRGAIAIMGRGRMIATMARGRMVAIMVPDLTKTTNKLARSYEYLRSRRGEHLLRAKADNLRSRHHRITLPPDIWRDASGGCGVVRGQLIARAHVSLRRRLIL